jgi:hypothetical protein
LPFIPTYNTTYQCYSLAIYVGWYSLINTAIPVATHGPWEAFAMWRPLHSYTLGLVGSGERLSEAAKAPQTRHAEILHIPLLRDNVLPREKSLFGRDRFRICSIRTTSDFCTRLPTCFSCTCQRRLEEAEHPTLINPKPGNQLGHQKQYRYSWSKPANPERPANDKAEEYIAKREKTSRGACND